MGQQSIDDDDAQHDAEAFLHVAVFQRLKDDFPVHVAMYSLCTNSYCRFTCVVLYSKTSAGYTEVLRDFG